MCGFPEIEGLNQIYCFCAVKNIHPPLLIDTIHFLKKDSNQTKVFPDFFLPRFVTCLHHPSDDQIAIPTLEVILCRSRNPDNFPPPLTLLLTKATRARSSVHTTSQDFSCRSYFLQVLFLSVAAPTVSDKSYPIINIYQSE